MHTHTLNNWQHEHIFLGSRHDLHERRTWWVVGLTASMMLVEIVGGMLLGSMALAADGWHMSTHAIALAIAALAYRIARTRAKDVRFSFGTGKFGELAAFASAVILLIVALLIGYESIVRLFTPVSIRFDEALPIAAVGLVVNVVSAWLLHKRGDKHSDSVHDEYAHPPVERTNGKHGHEHHRQHLHRHVHDTNIRAAYVHVLADALTSVLAISALLAGNYAGIAWLDPLMGLVGAMVIIAWSRSLLRSASATLLDVVPDSDLVRHIHDRIEVGGDRITDLHLWRVGAEHLGLIVSLVSDAPQPPEHYKALLHDMGRLSHVSVEVHSCRAVTI